MNNTVYHSLKKANNMSIKETLKNNSIFAYLTDEQLTELEKIVKTQSVDANVVLFNKGDKSESIYFIISGSVKVYEYDDTGKKLEFSILSAGDVFGELSIFDGKERSATVSCIEPCQFFILDKDKFISLIFSSVQFASNVFTSISNKIRISNEKITKEYIEKQKIQSDIEIERHRSIAMMVAGVAHEINTPIGIVNTAASYITEILTTEAVRSFSGNDQSKEILKDVLEAVKLIQNNIKRANKLIQNFKKISVSQINDKIEEVKLYDEVVQIVDLYKINLIQGKFEIKIINILNDQADVWIGYPGYLSQIIMNLLSNIERYAYPEKEGGIIEITLSEDNRNAPFFNLTVRDFGDGISPENLPKVFDPFFTTGYGKGGSGLGLALVYNFVTSLLKGTVDIQSALDKGTTVNISFPKVISQ